MSQTEVQRPRPEYSADAWSKKMQAAEILYHHKGRENAIKGEVLADKVGVGHTTVRDFIPDIIEAFRLPVGNCEDGYFVIQNADEFRHLMQQYESRRQSARERMQALSQAFYGDQEVWV